MSLKSLISQAVSVSPGVAFRKAFKKVSSVIKDNSSRKKDLNSSTYNFDANPPEITNSNFNPDYKINLRDEVIDYADQSCRHVFDFLGSGPVELCLRKNIGANANISNSNLLQDRLHKENHKAISGLIEKLSHGYQLIDWHIDFKIGYRWDAMQWYKDIDYGHVEGPDIKVPWELGRMQHLPALAIAVALSDDINEKKRYFIEFQDQLIDFIISNPPRFGPQWMTSMDVSIRAVNWLITRDIFANQGLGFSDEIDIAFRQSILYHMEHIISNDEWSSGMRGNHYLTNICGIIIICCYFDADEKIIQILNTYVEKLYIELSWQFNPDGSNFEASSSYHNLAAEIILFTYGMINNLSLNNIKKLENIFDIEKSGLSVSDSKIIFSEKLKSILQDIASFSFSILDIDNNMPLIGDDDSGYFFSILPPVKMENPNNRVLELYKSNFINIYNSKDIYNSDDISIYSFPKPEIKINFPDFGLYILRNETIFCTLRCGSVGQKGKGGHAHNDQLSIYLSVKGIEIFIDPGTFNYTAYHEKRNYFRSTNRHNTLIINDIEQNHPFGNTRNDLFWLKDKTYSKIDEMTPNSIKARHNGYGQPHIRSLKLSDTTIEGMDECSAEGQKSIVFILASDIEIIQNRSENSIVLKNEGIELLISFNNGSANVADEFYSPSYGLLKKTKKIVIENFENKIKWAVKLNK